MVKVLILNQPGSHMGNGSNSGTSTSPPAPCLWPGKAVEDGPKPWDPAPAWQTQKEAPGSWLRIRAAPGIVVTSGVNHRTQDLLLCLSASLYICLSKKINKSFLKTDIIYGKINKRKREYKYVFLKYREKRRVIKQKKISG